MSTIQFNLLPDVKAKYIDAQRNRKTITTACLIASAASVAIFILVFFSVAVVQKAQLSKANSDAKKAAAELKNIQGIEKIATVQNQLKTLAGLHQNKHAASRIFDYMPKVTPVSASISSLSVNFSDGLMQVSGTADSQATINTFVDTLKYATYRASGSDTDKLAFSNVVMTSFSISTGKASYAITANADPALFANPLLPAPTITVKNQVTTRSVIDDPANVLFNGQVPSDNKSGGQ